MSSGTDARTGPHPADSSARPVRQPGRDGGLPDLGGRGALRWGWRQLTSMRTALLLLVIPAVIFDPDQRGLHDKVVGTVLVRA